MDTRLKTSSRARRAWTCGAVAAMAGTIAITVPPQTASADITSFDRSVVIAADTLHAGTTYSVSVFTLLDTCTAKLQSIVGGQRVLLGQALGQGPYGSARATIQWTPASPGTYELIAPIHCTNGYFTDQGEMTVVVN
ncbi:hypothetical protein ACFWF7_39405 [Nocardia sp. NPDC060256]|uniref:hypothetical protein n=1 Tax=unclassified Nocardia TaxID=2637762 RepID=UPI0036549BAC